jgi:hypothetical protein
MEVYGKKMAGEATNCNNSSSSCCLREQLGLPKYTMLPCGKRVEIDLLDFGGEEEVVARDLLNLVIDEGLSWPFEKALTEDEFRNYFQIGFVVRDVEKQQEETRHAPLMGCFYIKPNFPGRCSHICNGGFITSPPYRRQGVATLMVSKIKIVTTTS